MLWGKQEWFCPNCGQKFYNEDFVSTTLAQTYRCSKQCGQEWERKR